MADDQKQIADEANRLYWATDLSVGEISEQLGISRRALYAAVRPEPAGAACPNCGAGLGFANRSAARARTAVCPACGLETEVERHPESDLEQARRAQPVGAMAEPDDELDRDELRERAIMIGTAALIGALIGSVVTAIVMRRD